MRSLLPRPRLEEGDLLCLGHSFQGLRNRSQHRVLDAPTDPFGFACTQLPRPPFRTPLRPSPDDLSSHPPTHEVRLPDLLTNRSHGRRSASPALEAGRERAASLASASVPGLGLPAFPPVGYLESVTHLLPRLGDASLLAELNRARHYASQSADRKLFMSHGATIRNRR